MKKFTWLLGYFILWNASTLFSQTNFYHFEPNVYFTYGSQTSTAYVNTDTAYYPNDSVRIIVDWNECSIFTRGDIIVEIEWGGYYTIRNLNYINNPVNCHHVDTFKVGPDIIVDALDFTRLMNTDNLRFRFIGHGYNPTCNCSTPFNPINSVEISYPQMYPMFTIDNAVFCEGDTVRFHDINTHSSVQRSWRFPGGVPYTSSDPNPVVTYANAGYHDVIMVVTNPYATDSVVLNNFIHINEGGSVDAGTDETLCAGDSIQLHASASGQSYVWISDPTLNDPFSLSTIVEPTQTTSYILWSGGWSSCSTYDTVTVNVLTPLVPVITFQLNTLESSPASSYQWFLDGNLILGANIQTYTPIQNGNYTVQTVDANGCSAISAPFTFTITEISKNENNPGSVHFNNSRKVIEVNSNREPVSSVVVYSVSGKQVAEAYFDNAGNQVAVKFNYAVNGIYFVKVRDTSGNESSYKLLCNF